MFIKSECSVKHFFEFSQDSAFFCIPDSSVSVDRVTTSSHNVPLHIPVNLFPSSPQYYLRNMRVVLFLVSVFGAITGSGGQEEQLGGTDHTVPE